MKTYLNFLLFALVFQSYISAQNTGEDKLGAWYEITSSNRISDKFSISGSFTNWDYELPADKEHLLLGTVGLNYHFNVNLV